MSDSDIPDDDDLIALLQRIESAMVAFHDAPEGAPNTDALFDDAWSGAGYVAHLLYRDYPEVFTTLTRRLISLVSLEAEGVVDYLIDELDVYREDLTPEHRVRLAEMSGRPKRERKPREKKPKRPRSPRPKRGDDDHITDEDLKDLEALALKLHDLLNDLTDNREQWIQLTIEIATTLRAARTLHRADRAFNEWLQDNGFNERIDRNDRAALINMGQNVTLLREIFEETDRHSWRLIWREYENRYHSAVKPEPPPDNVTPLHPKD